MGFAIRQPCKRCHHIKSLHYPPVGPPTKRRYPCNLIGCKCKNFQPSPRAKSYR